MGKHGQNALAALLSTAPCVVALCSLMWACADPAAWELKGEVKFIELRESIGVDGAKKAQLDYSIRNTGSSKIEGSSFAFSYSTNKTKYHFTVVDENAIKGGALVYGHVAVDYDSPDEEGSIAGAIVDSVQFK